MYVLCFSNIGSALALPYLQGRFIGAFAEGGSDMMRHLYSWLGGIFLASTISESFSRKATIVEAEFAFAVRHKYLAELYGKAVGLPWQWHQVHHSANVSSRISEAVEALYSFGYNQAWFLQTFIRLVGGLTALAILSPSIGLVVIIWIPLVIWRFRRIDIRLGDIRTEWSKADRHVATALADYLGNIGTLLSLRLQKATKGELSDRLTAVRAISARSNRLSANKQFLLNFTQSGFGIAVILLYVVLNRHVARSVLVASAVALQGYLGSVENSIHSLGWMQQSLLRWKVQLAGSEEIEQAAAVNETSQGSKDTNGSNWRDVEITGLTFRYEDQAHRTHHLDEVSLRLQRGRRIALVGPSGSGKGTLLRLMRGLHKPASGLLTIDAKNSDFAVLSGMSTLVLQDAEIFENTLRYNITFGIAADEAELARAADIACLAPVLAGLEKGLDTDIRERGVDLSGGQKQRLALARGLYTGRESSLLLLDEPTSSLDTVTEPMIFDRLFAARPDACIVASLHRLHLLDRFDHIYVMENGQVVEEGTFADLLARQGVLFTLWQAQKREESGNAPLPEG